MEGKCLRKEQRSGKPDKIESDLRHHNLQNNMDPGEAAAGEHRATRQSTLKISTALTVFTVAVLGNAVTSIITAVAAGAAAGAAAGIGIFQSLWEAEVRTGAIAVGVTAVTGGLAGTTAAILQSLLGAQSLTGSAVTGALAGAAMVTIARTQLQWAIETIQWGTDTIQWVVSVVQKIRAAVPAAKVVGGSGLAAVIVHQLLSAEESAASGSTVSRPASSGLRPSGPGTPAPAVSGPTLSEPGFSGPGASGAAASGPAVPGPQASGPAAVSGPQTSGPGPSGPGTPRPAVSGPASSGPGHSGPGTPGPAVSGQASSGPGPSGPGTPGPAVSGPQTSGPGPSGPGTPGPAVSGPASSGPGPSGPGSSGPAESSPPSSGPGSSRPGTSEPAVTGPTSPGPGPSRPGKSEPAVSGPPSSGPGTSGRALSAAAAAALARTTGAGVAAGAIGGMLGGFVAGARSKNNGSIQKNKSKARLAVTTEESPKTPKESSLTDKASQTDESSLTSVKPDSGPNDSNGETKDNGPPGVNPDQHMQRKTDREKIEQLFQRLCLDKNKNKLKIAEVCQFTAHLLKFLESCAEETLVWSFIQKLLMMNYSTRCDNEQHHTQKTDSKSSENNSDILKESEQIHPKDVQMAVFHCADSFLKQLMVTKLSQCQYALPLLVPDPFTRQIEFPLWTFRQINKSWKMRNTNNEIISQTQPIYKAETPMVFFFRFGSLSSSKSQLMNNLINEKHNTFFHRHCSGSSKTRVLMDGVVEIAWFCPSGINTDKFTDCVALCNLHGDAGGHEKQLQILTEMASVNVVLLPRLDRNDKHAAKIQNLYKDRKPLICIFTEDESIVTEMKKGKFKIGLKERSQSDVSEELRRTINDCLSETSFTFRLEDVSKHSDIKVDEGDDDDCRRGREAAQQTMSLLEKKDLTEIKDSFLPHQGKLCHQASRKPKENHDESEQLRVEHRISEELQAAAFGLEHKKDLQVHFSSLPSLAAEMMISGSPLELMDGDAAHVPVVWISAVLDQLIQKLGDQRVFVLSVLGIQSSGISTMLNAMFGLQFAVSAGRRTRGAFMQLVKVSDEMKTQMSFAFILVVYTKGLGALELAGRSTRDHDNELATFVVGLGNLTLINIFGENPAEMQDILQIVVQVFMRMKKARLNPRCVCMLQNVLHKEKNMDGKRWLQEKLNESKRWLQEKLIEMTKLAAKEEDCDAECFSDIIRFDDVQTKVNYFSQLWEGLPMAPQNPKYCENILELKKTILSHAGKSHGMTLKGLKDRIKDLWEAAAFNIKIKDLQGNIVRETQKKLNDVHVNTLYEKSKEFVFKLKDKELNEETMKKEFDSFWKQYLNTIITDIPAIEDIDVMKDVSKILNDSYGSLDHWTDIFSLHSYSNYVWLKKSSELTGLAPFINVFRSYKEKFGFILSQEDETQIKSLVQDILQTTENIIQMLNISKKGYNISYIQRLISEIILRVSDHQKRPVKYAFKREFYRDLILSICKRMNEKITDQHRLFRDSNAPFIFVEIKRKQYYSVFQYYCHGAMSAAIFGDIICQKLKGPIKMNIYKKTARDLADEMRTECASLNGNRSNLENHILEKLAEEEDFRKYIDYFDNPRDHFKRFIRDEVSKYITDKFSVSVLPKMKENTKLLQQKIMKAAHEATEHVQVNRGDARLWLKSFTQQLSDELIFSEKDLIGVKHDVDFIFLEDVIIKTLIITAMTADISNTDKYNTQLNFTFRPDELLIHHFCQCCWVGCPFCGATCTNTLENHDGDHSAPFHRVVGINGYQCLVSNNFSVDICTKLVASDEDFLTCSGFVLCKEYREAGEAFAKWSITPDSFELPYWKWFVCRFQKDLENHYKKKIKDEIPDQWKKLRKQDAIESLDKYF